MKELIRPNGFGPFYCEGLEILRHIFVSVRDRQWREISPAQWTCQIEQGIGRIVVEARHASAAIDFEWRGLLDVAADGRRIRFGFEGVARRAMEVCRLGLVVLHPVAAMVGARLIGKGQYGSSTLVVSREVVPQPIIEGLPCAIIEPFSRLTIEQGELGLMQLIFQGDDFELEDQRNWGDASFKTYCTPLRRGFPRSIQRGERIAHQVEVRIEPKRKISSESKPSAAGVFPKIGCMWPGPELTSRSNLDWHHLSVDLADSPGTWREADWTRDAAMLEVGADAGALEVQFPALTRLFDRCRGHFARVLLYGSSSSPPSLEKIAEWREALDAIGARDVPLLAATRGYFVEHNRTPSWPLGSAGGVGFPLTSSVHADDAATLAENVAAIRDMADTARTRGSSEIIAIAPLARYYPVIPVESPAFPPDMLAPWLVAILLASAEAQVTSVTLSHDVLSGLPEVLLRQLLSCCCLEVTSLASEHPRHLIGAALCPSKDGQERILIANLSAAPMPWRPTSTVRGQSIVGVEIPAYGVRWLDEGPISPRAVSVRAP